IIAFPLTDARSASVSENRSTNGLERFELPIAFDGLMNLFRTWCDQETALRFQSTFYTLFSHIGRARHVFIRRVRATADQCEPQPLRPFVLAHIISQLRNGASHVW